MRHKLAIAMAVFLVAGMAGLSVTPTAAAGHDECHEDYNITTQRAQRTLPASGVEVGLSVVDEPLSETLLVILESNQDEMEFTIFEEVGGVCSQSSNVSPNCSGTVGLSTTGIETMDSEQCILQASLSEAREFFIVFENLQSTDSLDYSVASV